MLNWLNSITKFSSAPAAATQSKPVGDQSFKGDVFLLDQIWSNQKTARWFRRLRPMFRQADAKEQQILNELTTEFSKYYGTFPVFHGEQKLELTVWELALEIGFRALRLYFEDLQSDPKEGDSVEGEKKIVEPKQVFHDALLLLTAAFLHPAGIILTQKAEYRQRVPTPILKLMDEDFVKTGIEKERWDLKHYAFTKICAFDPGMTLGYRPFLLNRVLTPFLKDYFVHDLEVLLALSGNQTFPHFAQMSLAPHLLNACLNTRKSMLKRLNLEPVSEPACDCGYVIEVHPEDATESEPPTPTSPAPAEMSQTTEPTRNCLQPQEHVQSLFRKCLEAQLIKVNHFEGDVFVTPTSPTMLVDVKGIGTKILNLARTEHPFTSKWPIGFGGCQKENGMFFSEWAIFQMLLSGCLVSREISEVSRLANSQNFVSVTEENTSDTPQMKRRVMCLLPKINGWPMKDISGLRNIEITKSTVPNKEEFCVLLTR